MHARPQAARQGDRECPGPASAAALVAWRLGETEGCERPVSGLGALPVRTTHRGHRSFQELENEGLKLVPSSHPAGVTKVSAVVLLRLTWT